MVTARAGITAFGGYIPRLRLGKSAIAGAHAWIAPGLKGQAKGERSMANWDEDSVTMAVEAGRDCLGDQDRSAIDAVYMASTSMPFLDRQNAGIVGAALNLSEEVNSLDVGYSQRAGTSGLMAALAAVQSGMSDNLLYVAADQRAAKPGSVQELQYGDGAAALTIGVGQGDNPVIAEFIGSHSVTVDFLDHYKGEGEDFDYVWEERWIKEEGYQKIVPRAVQGLLDKVGISGDKINHFVMPCVFARLAGSVAKKIGLPETSVRDALGEVCGEAGTAHALIMLVHALQEAKPGEKILVASFGHGCDAMLFEVTDEIASLSARQGIVGALAHRRMEDNYGKFQAFSGAVVLEKGIRAELDTPTPATTLYRNREMVTGMVGGKCRKCGTVQFPRKAICISPNCDAINDFDDLPFADRSAKLASWSADWLGYSLSPPNHYGMIEFDEGGRFMCDLTECEEGKVAVGTKIKMMFRIKSIDAKRGFRRYFWKGTPIS